MTSTKTLAGLTATLLAAAVLTSACSTEPGTADSSGPAPAVSSSGGSEAAPATTSPPPSSKPLPKDDIMTVVYQQEDLTMLAEALKVSDLAGAMRGRGPYTLLAPNNAAFEQLGPETWAALLKPENKQVLLSLLATHVLPAAVPSDDIPASKVPSLAGVEVQLSGEAGYIELEGRGSSRVDLPASNGVVHVIEALFVPPTVDLDSIR